MTIFIAISAILLALIMMSRLKSTAETKAIATGTPISRYSRASRSKTGRNSDGDTGGGFTTWLGTSDSSCSDSDGGCGGGDGGCGGGDGGGGGD